MLCVGCPSRQMGARPQKAWRPLLTDLDSCGQKIYTTMNTGQEGLQREAVNAASVGSAWICMSGEPGASPSLLLTLCMALGTLKLKLPRLQFSHLQSEVV